MTQLNVPRYGVDARWWTAGPPSGRNYVRHLIAELAADPNSNDYIAFARNGARRASAGNVPIRVVALPSMPAILFNSVGVQARMPGSVKSVLYQNFTPPVSRAGSVTVVHDLIFMTHPEYFGRAERLYLSLVARLLPRATIVAAVSEHVRNEVLERWPSREPGSVVVAPNGIGERLLSAAANVSDPDADRAALARLGVSHPYVLYLGRLNVRKNLSRLIAAFAAADLEGFQLVLAGPPDASGSDLAAQSERLGIRESVRLIGRVADTALPALLRNANVFAYVSLEEGFGVPPLEAMAFGIPVVCSDIPALRETAAEGGALFASADDVEAIADCLRRAAMDEALRGSALVLGPAQAQRHRWQTTAQILRKALEQAASR